MLDKLVNKKVTVGVAFGALANGNYTSESSTEYIEGVFEAYDDKFVMLSGGNVIGIRFIQTIKINE